MSNSQRLRVEIRGAVQGVGFRPFVYRLATGLGLAGWIVNDTRGVFLEVEGPASTLERFLQRLETEKPPLSIIQNLTSAWLEPAGYERFEIRHSNDQGAKTAFVLPDVATCPDCLHEVLDPADRRHRYPFTNCTNCGPRFTIIEALPYDRPNTSMRRFTMCPACKREYEDPLDRRFHAQPNACPVCGPRLALYDCGLRPAPLTRVAEPGRADRFGVREIAKCGVNGKSAISHDDVALSAVATALRAGRIVAVKGLGGFHLVVDARNREALALLRERKPRHAKPFALMVRDLDQARLLCEISPEAEALLGSPEAPIVLLRRRLDAPVSDLVAPGNLNLGVMLPYTPLHHLLLRELNFPVVATSGNLTDEPICTDEAEAMIRLDGIADLFLVHDRPIVRHVDDSVAWILEGQPRLLRRARGYAPLPVILSEPVPTILAVGGHLKNTVALSVGQQVFISQHIGDLETPEAMLAFERVIADFLRLYEATPVAIAHDLHPNYLSTKWAMEQGSTLARTEKQEGKEDHLCAPTHLLSCNLVGVQHHHAHLAACLAENGIEGPALGVTWDGTGYGIDGTVWGGEFLLGDAARFERVAHLRPFRLPGGDAAVHEPRRVALALLWETFGGDDALKQDDLAPLRAFRPAERRLLTQMLRGNVNCPVTTSTGRLFDGVAALLDLHQEVSFEGQAAMALEFAAEEDEDGAYPIVLSPKKARAGGVVSPESALASLGRPLARGAEPGWTGQPDPLASSGQDKAGVASARPGDGAPCGPGFPLVLDWAPLVEAILVDLRRGVDAHIIAARFHNALVEAIVDVAQKVGQPRVALSGGCFQNRLLTERTADRLRRAGFEVLLHRQVPPNDGGISLGQIAVAAARLTASGNSEFV